MFEWQEISEVDYFDALEVLSPAIHMPYGFLHGESHGYRVCTVSGTLCADYPAFVRLGDTCYGGTFMTINEFRRCNPKAMRKPRSGVSSPV